MNEIIEQVPQIEEVKKVKINNLHFDVSQTEFDYLIKFHEDDRLATLCSLRFETHVLTQGGKKKVDTLTRIKSRNAIRFACEFFKHGMTNG